MHSTVADTATNRDTYGTYLHTHIHTNIRTHKLPYSKLRCSSLPATLPQRVESPLSCLVAGKLSASACIIFGIWRSFNLPASCRVALRLCHWVACVILENARIGQVKGIRIGTVCQAYFPTMCVCEATLHASQIQFCAIHTHTNTVSLTRTLVGTHSQNGGA